MGTKMDNLPLEIKIQGDRTEPAVDRSASEAALDYLMEEGGVNLQDVVSCDPRKPALHFPQRYLQPGYLKVLFVVPRAADSEGSEEEQKNRKHKSKSLDLYEVRFEKPRRTPPEVPGCPLYRKYDVTNFVLVHFDQSCDRKVLEALLRDGVSVQEGRRRRKYVFLGHSPSQLRNATCVLFNADMFPGLDTVQKKFDRIVSAFGDFARIKNVSKRAARIGLLLSTSKPVLHLTDAEIGKVEDIESSGYNFTDGCGDMSLEVARRVVQELKVKTYDHLHQTHKVPSVIQVRLKGCKGVLALNPAVGAGVSVRPSMEKFPWNAELFPAPYPLGITDSGAAMSRPYTYASLNKQFILLLSALGVADDILLRKQNQHFLELQNLLTDPELQIRYLCAEGHFDLAEFLLHPDPDLSPGTREALQRDVQRTLREIIHRAGKNPVFRDPNPLTREKTPPAKRLRIPLERARNVYGVCDQSGQLEYGTCFFQPTVKDGPQILEGVQVLVGKNPSYHPGDMRVLRCAHVPELAHLVDCIVFPTQGPRPHSDEIAGSDLDGDQYFVCWDPDLLPPNQVQPTSYQGQSAKPQREVTHKDLVTYFANYDRRKVGQLDSLFNKWADSRGVTSEHCKIIASIFNIAIDSAKTGKVVPIPEFLRQTPPEPLQRFVWQRMSDRADSYLQDRVQHMSESEAEDDVMMIPDRAFLEELVRNPDSRASEFHMFRLVHTWCRGQDDPAALMKDLLPHINFAKMSRAQRRRADVDLVAMGIDGYKPLSNTLYNSRILRTEDIDVIKGEHEMSWVLYYQCFTDFWIPWDVFNTILQTPAFKLLVFRLSMRGEEWVTSVSLPHQLRLQDVVEVGTEDCPGRVFVSVHKERTDCIKAGLSQKENKRHGQYYIALDGRRLQIYSDDRSGRKSTFVCLKDDTDDRIAGTRLSVDFTRFSQSSFSKQHGNPRINNQALTGFEVYLCAEDPMVSPTLYNYTCRDIHTWRNPGSSWDGYTGSDQESTAEVKHDHPATQEFIMEDRDFPELGERPPVKMSDTDRVDRSMKKLIGCFQRSDVTGANMALSESIDVMMKNDDLAFVTACRLETLLWNWLDAREQNVSSDQEQGPVSSSPEPALAANPEPTQVSSDPASALVSSTSELSLESPSAEPAQVSTSPGPAVKVGAPESNLATLSPEPSLVSADSFLHILKVLVKFCQHVDKLNRLVDTMETCHVVLSPSHVTDFLLFVVFEAGNRREALRFLQYFMHSDCLLDADDFHPEASGYFLLWSCLVTVELLAEVQEVESSYLRQKEFHWGTVMVEEETVSKDTVLKTYLNVEGGKQPFHPEDAVMIYTETDDVRTSVYFAEINDITGQLLQVTLIWPEDSEARLRAEVKKNSVWRLKLFPSLVSHRRRVQALQAVCVKPDQDDENDVKIPSDVILNLVASFRERSPDVTEPELQSVIDEFQSRKFPTAQLETLLKGPRAEEGAAAGPETKEVDEESGEVEEKSEATGSEATEARSSDPAEEGDTCCGLRVNASQARAIHEACNGKVTLIQGPPGTGKTYTAALIVRKWLEETERTGDKILVVGETNEAVNNVLLKLVEVGVDGSGLLRVTAPGRPAPEQLTEVSFDHKYRLAARNRPGGKVFFDKEAALKIVQDAKVVCATCMSAGRRFLQQFSFSRVLVDEAAQALEPSVLVPLSLPGVERICLVGDDMQLPPFSRCAAQFPQMGVSLFARLRQDGVPVHMLDTQYRMHRQIAAFPSQTFYQGALRTGVPDTQRVPPPGMPKPECNLCFLHLQASRRRAVGTSKENEEEAQQVEGVLKALLASSDVPASQIGVISPYKAQVRLIQEKLRAHPEVDVRTVDGFQGQEREVIIVSSVVSDEHVGFLDNANRMNVMLTRAKRALILIGHRDALYTCALWKQWVQHVKSEGLVVEPVARQPGGACAEAVYRGTRAGRNRRGAAGRGARYRDSEDRPETGSDKFQGGTSTSGSRRNTSGGRKPRGSRGGWGVGRGQTGGADREVIYSRHSQ